VAAANATPKPPYDSWARAATNIQDAIEAAILPGATVLVSNGVYQTGGRTVYGTLTNRVAVTKPLRLLSVNGPQVTTICGYQAPGAPLSDNSIRCVYLTNDAVLAGFTLTNGGTHAIGSGDAATEAAGGGVWCESLRVVVSDCVLVGNSAYYGGGAASGRLQDCQLLGNSAGSEGGGTFDAIVERCVLLNNSAGDSGGGCHGGAYYTTLANSLLVSNTANIGGGAYQAVLTNCTLVGNASIGADSCQLYNCILYYNGLSAAANYFSGSLTNCCTVPLAAGTGNFTNAPLFVDLTGGDFHLRADSPCIGAGDAGFAPGSADLDGRPRLVGAGLDLGAFEFQGTTGADYLKWLVQYRLPSRFEADAADPDHDGISNWQEWLAGTVPTNAASALRLLTPTKTSSGLTITWQSVTNRTYALGRCAGLGPGAAFTSLTNNLAGKDGTTSFTDSSATGPGPYFYRVSAQP
jgi:hypothetical protein